MFGPFFSHHWNRKLLTVDQVKCQGSADVYDPSDVILVVSVIESVVPVNI